MAHLPKFMQLLDLFSSLIISFGVHLCSSMSLTCPTVLFMFQSVAIRFLLCRANLLAVRLVIAIAVLSRMGSPTARTAAALFHKVSITAVLVLFFPVQRKVQQLLMLYTALEESCAL